jgi:ATP-dependent helicase YprA (DUF1998 family)
MFSSIGGTTPASSARRLKVVENALLERAIAHHTVFLRAHERWHNLINRLTGTEGSFILFNSWHPLWRWSSEDDSMKNAYQLPDVTPPPCSAHMASAVATDPFKMPPAPFDADRALTGRQRTLLRERPTIAPSSPPFASSFSFFSSSSFSSSTDIEPTLILDSLKELPFYSGQVAHVHEFPALQGAFTDFGELVFTSGVRRGERVVSAAVEHALRTQGVTRLFSHQAIAIEAALSDVRRHVALSTGTSSGKSVCFNVPVIQSILEAPESVALYLYPTKALAQDQFGAFCALLGGGEAAADSLGRIVKPAVVDGDASFTERSWARAEGNVIMTNPDMLHISVLPNHGQWKRVLMQLRFVVIDEGHTYKGIFGAHVAMILRRLLRLARHYKNNSLQFIYASATIANPLEHLSHLVPLHVLGGRDRVQLITNDTAPRGRKLWCLWNPPILSQGRSSQNGVSASREPAAHFSVSSSLVLPRKRGRAETSEPPPPEFVSAAGNTLASFTADSSATDSRRASTIVEAARVFTALVKRGVRVLCFAKTRKLTELVLRYSLQDLHATAPGLVSKVKAYRGGYTKAARRAIEQDLFEHRLLGVTATNALELGIDVGSLDVTMHVGFPGSVSSLRQQAGRAGRSGKRGLAILVAFDSPLDQLFVREPEALFELPSEAAIVPVANRHVLRAQLLCAAHELPLRFFRTSTALPINLGGGSGGGSSGSGGGGRTSVASRRLQTHFENLAACAHQAAVSATRAKKSPELDDDDGILFGYAPSLDVLESLLSSDDMVAVTSSESLHLAAALDGGTAPLGIRIDLVSTTLQCHRAIETPATANEANIRQIDPVST